MQGRGLSKIQCAQSWEVIDAFMQMIPYRGFTKSVTYIRRSKMQSLIGIWDICHIKHVLGKGGQYRIYGTISTHLWKGLVSVYVLI